MAKPFQFRLRTLLLAIVPVAFVALPLGWYLRLPLPPQPVEVTGTVTLDGVPLAGAHVAFVSITGKTKSARVITDAAGTFILYTRIDRLSWKLGVMPGSYVVLVSKIDPARLSALGPAIKSIPPGIELYETIEDSDTAYLTPSRYTDFSMAGLTAEVTPAGPNVFTFNLTTP